jgi:hypothetical protein
MRTGKEVRAYHSAPANRTGDAIVRDLTQSISRSSRIALEETVNTLELPTLVSDHLRAAPVKAGVIAADWNGRCGFHHSVIRSLLILHSVRFDRRYSSTPQNDTIAQKTTSRVAFGEMTVLPTTADSLG